MSDLGTALRELADRAQLADGEGGAGLWRRGRRRMRRRRALAAGVVAVVLVGVGLGAALSPRPVAVMPAGPVHAPAFPKHLYQPSRWLAGTGDRGPLGQLALIAPAEHRDGDGIVGISATTGEYRFLDLPGWVRGSQSSLAPDGRHVAYWTTGHPTGTSYPDPLLAGSRHHQVIAGVALYDTVTGRTQRTELATEHGMSDEPLFWRDSTTVYFGDWQLSNSHGATRTRSLSVAVGRPDPIVVPNAQAAVMDGSRNADGSFLVARGAGRRLNILRPSADGTLVANPTRLRLPATLPDGTQPAYSDVSLTGADRVVVQVDAGGDGRSNTLMVGAVSADGTVHGLKVVGDSFQDARVLGWHDPRTLLAYGRDSQGAVLAAVDVSTGSLVVLSRGGDGWATDLDPAADVLRGNLVAGLKPPDPVDPRLRDAGLVVGALVLAGGGLWLVRRRRRA